MKKSLICFSSVLSKPYESWTLNTEKFVTIFYLLLYNQGLSNMILETLRVSVKLEEANNNLERYAKSMIAGMIWGWIDEWMRQGMPETPEEIVLLTAQLNKEQPKQ